MWTTFHLVHRLHTKRHSTAVTRYRCPDIPHGILGQRQLTPTLAKAIDEVTRSFPCVPLLDSGLVCILHDLQAYILSEYSRGLDRPDTSVIGETRGQSIGVYAQEILIGYKLETYTVITMDKFVVKR